MTKRKRVKRKYRKHSTWSMKKVREISKRLEDTGKFSPAECMNIARAMGNQ